MTTDIHIKHPLRRRGLSQSERIAKALLPGEFRLDERSIQDLITAAYDYARFMRFYTPEGRPEGDWRPFWEVENLTYLAVLAALDTDQMRKTYEDTDLRLSEVLGAPKTAENDAKVLALFQQLMVTLRDMAAKLEQHYRTLRPEIPIKSLILNRIKRDYKNDPEELERPMQRLIRYHKGADDHLSYRDYEVFFAGSQYNTDNRWGIENRDFYDQLLTNPDFDREKLRALFLGFFDTFRVVKTQAQRLFDEELANIQLEETETQQRLLQPHVALFLAFLQLFRHAQESLNEVPKRHLDFYYEQVLGLERNKDGVPDHAYLIFTLAKEFSSELLEKGAQLLGGKDKNGQPLFFETLEQWRVTQAQVAETRSVRFDLENKHLVSASNAESSDGQGASFPRDQEKRWRAFGDESVHFDEVGFAIASAQLLLREGRRIVDLTFHAPGLVLPEDDIFSISFTTKQGLTTIDIPFDSGLRTETDWLTVNGFDETAWKLGYKIIPPISAAEPYYRIRIVLPYDFPGIEADQSGKINVPWPLIRIALNNTPDFIENYSNLRKCFLKTSADGTFFSPLSINVWALDIRKNLILQNDFGVFDGTERFYPFGPVPQKEARFFVGCEEAFQKSVSNLKFSLDWVDAPIEPLNNSASGYYKFYTKNPIGSVDATLLDRANFASPIPDGGGENGEGDDEEADNGDDGEVEELAFSERSLEGAPAGPVVTPPINLIIGDRMSPVFNLSVSNFQRDIQETSATKFAPTVKRGFMRFTFKGDFLHDEYAKVMVAQSTQVAQGVGNMQGKIEALKRAVNGLSGEGFSKANVISAIDNNIHGSSPNDLPNEPYTPSTNGIGLSYYSSQQLDSYDYFYHVLPFKKLKKLESYPPFVNIPLVDVFELGAIPDTSAKPLQPNAVQVEWSAANLYIGLSDLLPGDALSLLFMLRAGTEPDPDMEAPYIKWFYLAESNTWQPLPPNRILSDQTNGLTRTGIIQIATPVTMSRRGNTILPPDLHWLRASAVEVYEEDNNGDFAGWVRTVRAFPDFIDIRAQAVEAVFRSEPGNELSHLAQPLPANTITKLAISRSAIKKVEQLQPSFGGKLPETEGFEFYRRVSERLRHKDRAVTISDFERIVLEYSAEVALAKCISHTRYYPQALASELAPGYVTVAVVPDLLRRPGAVRAEPRFSKGELEDIRQMLIDRANLFLAQPDALRVLNPQYEPIRIVVELKFVTGDETLFRYQLDEALRRFLAPWLYNPADGPVFGRILYNSHLVHLIENLEFVEFVKDLNIYQLVGKNYDAQNPPEEPEIPFHSEPPASDDEWYEFLVKTEKIQPGTARSILTTIAGKHRVITVEERRGNPDPSVDLQPRMIPPPPPSPIVDTTAPTLKITAKPPVISAKTAASPASKTTSPAATPKTAIKPAVSKPAAPAKSKAAAKPKTATPPPAPKPASKPPEKKTGAKTASKPRKK